MRDPATTRVGWDSVIFLVAIVLFGVIWIGHGTTWPIYSTVIAWWGYVVWRINQKYISYKSLIIVVKSADAADSKSAGPLGIVG
jgi:hypothetical protein